MVKAMKDNRQKKNKEYQCMWRSQSKHNQLAPAQLVKSIQGRDINSYYLVLSIEDNIAFVVDGRKRSVDNPKRKNYLHLQAIGKVAADLAQKLADGKSITDEEIRENLTGFLQSPQG